MKKTILFISLIYFFSCNNKNSTENKTAIKPQAEHTEIKYVTAKSGLNYRKKPKKEVIGKFEYGKALKIIEHTNIFENIKDENKIIKNEWLGVIANNDTVYVFGGYLSIKQPPTTLKPQIKQSPYNILLPTTYRDWQNENPANYLNKEWLALYKKDSKYYIKKASYRIERGESGCTGDSTKTIRTQSKTLLFIKNSNINYGEIHHEVINKNMIWPEEKIVYNYNNVEYNIRAEGQFTSPEKALLKKDTEFYAEVKNYKLYISTNNTNEMLFLEEASFNDTFVKILFVGDIDSDGKLDFIIEANRDYEEERVLLFLSSESQNNEIIKKTGEIVIQFDC